MADVEFTIERSGYLPIHLNTDHGGSYALQSGTTGFGVPQVVPQFMRGAGNGASYRGERVDTRVMDLEILIMGESRIATGELLRKLSNIMRARRNQPLPRLVAEYATGEVYEIAFVYRSGLEIEYSEAQARSLRVVVSVECPDPFWVARDSESFTIGNDSAAVGLLPDLAALNVSASTAIGSVPVENPGDVDTEVSWQLTGPGGPTTVEVNGEGFTYEPVLASGEVVFVDGRDRAVVDAAGVNRYSGLAASPRFPLLQPGLNDVFISMEGASQGSWVESGLVFGTNHVANSSMEASSGSSALFTNLVTNPSMESVASGTTTVRTNLVTNPSFETNTTGALAVAECTIARTNTTAYVGSYSLAATSTAAANVQVGFSGSGTSGITITAGTQYSLSFYVSSAAVQRQVFARILWYDAAGALLSFVDGTSASTQVGTFTRRTVTATAPANAVYTQVRAFCSSVSSVGEVHYFDAVQLEVGSTASDYFDGNTVDALGWDYGWSGTAHASTSTAKASVVTVRENLVTNPSFEVATTEWSAKGSATISRDTTQFYVGSASAKVVTSGSGVNEGIVAMSIPISQTGAVHTASAWVKGQAGAALQIRLSNNVSAAPTFDFTATGSWQRVQVSNTASALVPLAIEVRTQGTLATTFYVDAVQLEVGSVASDYFDGSTSASGDFTYAWSGTAHASTSLQRGVGVTSVASGASASISSTEWASTGTKSLRIIPTTSGISTAIVAGSNTSMSGYGVTFIAGKTYTVAAKLRLNAALTTPHATDSRRLRVAYNTQTGFTGATYLYTTQASNVAGITSHSLTFTLPSNAVWCLVQVYNGASAGNGDVWWDDLIVVEGTYTGDYFDGNSTSNDSDFTIAWNGYAHASTSAIYADAISGINGMTPVNAVSNRSSQWYKVGTKSYRIIPTSSSNETYGHTPSYTITAGKQYTATGVLRIPQALIGTLHADALKLRVNINNGTSYIKTDAAPNTPGEYAVSVTFTAPAGATTARLELMNGASAGKGNVWWDTIGLIDIPDATFFDGSTTTVRENAYVWTGTPNDSTSQWRQRTLEGKSSVTAYYKPKREVIY